MNGIINIVKKLLPNKYIAQSDKKELEKLCEELDKIKHDKLIEGLKEVIKSTKYTKKLKETLENLTKDLQEEGITQEEANKLLEETIEVIQEIEEEDLEKELDKECERYNKFSESNPAEYINYNKTNSNYVLTIDKKEIKSKKLSNLTIKLKENLQQKKKENFRKKMLLKKISYGGKKIIIYFTENNKAYFDINHVINLLNDKGKKDKYAEYKNEIELYDVRDNEYGGFYVKEYISKETYFNILLHSNSAFAHKFKVELSKILDEMTDKGTLIINNDKLMIIDKKKPIEYLTEEYNYTQTYDNDILVNFVKDKIKDYKKENWNKYLNRHIMYFFIITLEDPKGLNRILCKIGYSCDILQRIKSLEGEYKCKFYLIGIKLVHSVQDEKEFHNLLKRKYPELSVELKIGNTDKDETYVFDIELYKTYLNNVDKGEYNTKDIEIEQETKRMIEEYFENMDIRYENEIMLKMKPQIKINEIITKEHMEYTINLNNKYYDYITLKETNRHKEVMKDKEIILREKDLEIKKVELEIIRANK